MLKRKLKRYVLWKHREQYLTQPWWLEMGPARLSRMASYERNVCSLLLGKNRTRLKQWSPTFFGIRIFHGRQFFPQMRARRDGFLEWCKHITFTGVPWAGGRDQSVMRAIGRAVTTDQASLPCSAAHLPLWGLVSTEILGPGLGGWWGLGPWAKGSKEDSSKRGYKGKDTGGHKSNYPEIPFFTYRLIKTQKCYTGTALREAISAILIKISNFSLGNFTFKYLEFDSLTQLLFVLFIIHKLLLFIT